MERQFKRITRDSIPCWYELSWQKKEPAIILRVHQDFIESTAPVKQDAPIVIGLKENLGFKKFTGSLNENFGFDDALEIQAPKDKFTEFLIRIPEIKKLTREKCRSCGGTGKDEFRAGEKCFRCGGIGKEIYYDFMQAETISASLTVFFLLAMLTHSEKETSSPVPQLLTVKTTINRDMGRRFFVGGMQPVSSRLVIFFSARRTCAYSRNMPSDANCLHQNVWPE